MGDKIPEAEAEAEAINKIAGNGKQRLTTV